MPIRLAAITTGRVRTPWKWINRLLRAGLLVWSLSALATPPPGGIAPVTIPAGGFAIDGDLMANKPLSGVGDWIGSTNGTGGGVLTAAGVPIDPTRTFHFIDPYNSGSDLTFVGGEKWTDNPNSWTWTTGKPSSKTDINNALLHIATDTNGHTWVIVAADRLSTSGSSYIDFEFLQNLLVRTTNGAFVSSGPNGGRTVGDLVLSLAFGGGGSTADFFAFKWETNGSGGFAYVDVTASMPTGRVFVALNSNTVAVPFGAFGQTNYSANAFVEAALDMSAMIGGFDPCVSFGFKTIMIKTKSSTSSTATIEDFIDPIQYNLKIGPTADAGADQTLCTQGASTAFPLHGIATAGLQPVTTTTWSVVSGNATIDDTNSLNTTARVSSATATVRLTVVEQTGCTETNDAILTVKPLPTCSITGSALVCPLSSNQFIAPAGMTSYSWSIAGNGSISGATNASAVSVSGGSNCGTNFTLTLTVVSNGCPSVCSMDVLVNDTTPPTITCPADRTLECPAITTTNVTGVAAASDGCGRVSVSYADVVTTNCANTKVIARTWTATDLCGNVATCVQTITVQDTTPPSITCPANVTLECPALPMTNVTGAATASDGCGSVTVTYSDSVSNSCAGASVVSRTWTATDACGNARSCVQTITIRDTTKPVLTMPADVVLECPADTSTNNTGVATATDTCSQVTVSDSDSISNSCAGAKVITRTWTASDQCSNTVSAVQKITVRDTTKPVLAVPADVVLECPADTTTNNTGVATATDTCSQATVRYSDSVSNSCAGAKVITRTWTASDQCSNSINAVQMITVRDTTPPSLTIPSDLVLECPAVTTTNATGVATATDGCGTVTIAYADQVTTNCANTKVIARTWTATDQCGNRSSAVQMITVQDTTAPVIHVPIDLVLECPAVTTTNATGVATATDGCGTVAISFSDQVTTNCANTKVIARTWTATDQCGNSSSALQAITVRDTTPPSITCPANVTLECPALPVTNVTGVATASDGCGSVTVSYNDSISNSCAGASVIARTWTATDQCGNSRSCVQTITIRDTTRPVLTMPADVVLECPADTSTNNTGVATATDTCSQVTVRYSDSVSNSCAGASVITRTWTAVDECINSISAVQKITVRDTTKPVLTLPADVVQECPADTSTNNTGVATATDTCSQVNVRFSDSVSNNCAGTKVIARTWTATDQCNNSISRVQTITVRDTTPPALTIPSDLVLECPAVTTTNVTGVATATDGCGTVTVGYSDQVTTNCANTKVIARTWTATDQCGNRSSSVQTITVRDTTAPVIHAPSDLVLECPATTTTNATGVATATDGCGSVSITFSDQVTTNCANTKVIARTWTATDQCGNSSSAVQTISVRDTTPPTITAPANLVLDCPAITTTNATGVATASDGCGSVSISYSDSVSNSCGGTKVISRTWTATDQCGNSKSALQTITVRDITPPAITAPSNLVLECPAVTTTNATGVAIASDGCSAVTISYSDVVSNNCGGTKLITRTWTATDACGNSASALQTITVRDTTAPNITAPANLTLECPAITTTNATGVAAASDGCGSVLVTYSDLVSNGCAGTEVISRTWTAVDQCGNSASAIQTITVRDITRPSLIIPSNVVLECPSVATGTNVTGVATAQDTCSAVTLSYNDAITTNCGATMMIARTWTAVDGCGNSTSAVQTVTVRDTTPPTITCPSNLVLECPAVTTTNLTGVATAQDGCGAVSIRYSDSVSNSCGGAKVISRTWTATDACGNNASCVQTITVRDTQPPLVTCPPDISLECGASTSPTVTGMAAATDGCGTASVTYSDAVTNTCGGARIITRTWSATDGCGNIANCVQHITVRDTTPPTITCAPISANTFSQGGWSGGGTAGSLLAAHYLDVFPQGVMLGIYAPTNGNAAPNGLWWQPNAAGLTALQSANSVGGGGVSPISQDAVNPTTTYGAASLGRQSLALICNMTFNEAGYLGDGPNNFGSLIYTNSGGDSLNGYTIRQIVAAANRALAGLGLPAGYDFNSLTALINNLNVSYEPSLSSWAQSHLSAPMLVVQCPGQVPSPNPATVSASDSCSSPVTITNLPDMITQQTCPNRYLITRTWVARDACGNTNTCSYQIQVNDTTPPTITCPPNVTVDCTVGIGTNVTGLATAQDNCGSVTVTYSDIVSNGCGGWKTISRVWLAADVCGNSNTCVQIITVRDNSRPTIQCPVNLVLDCPADTSTNFTGVPTVQSGCSQPTLAYSDSVVTNCGSARTISRAWTATDGCGNSASCVQTILVRDTMPPTITPPPSLVLECPANISTNATGVATATDGCSSVSIGYSDSVTTNCGSARTITRTWTATDACGNAGSAVQTITVRDTTAPTITAPANVVLECPANTSTNATGVATATDGCSSVSISYSDSVATNCGSARTITRRWTATDACGNSASATQIITVQDTTKPTLTVPPNVTLECPATDTSTNVTGSATATDSCGSASIAYADQTSSSGTGTNVISRTWTAADQCGNSISAVQTITVRDSTPPQITSKLISSYAASAYGSAGSAAALLQSNYTTVFPDGVQIGIAQSVSGSGSVHGLTWQSNTAGLSSLQTTLTQCSGSAGAIAQNAINSSDTLGGGSLACQTIALTLNIGFNTVGVLGTGPNNFGSLIYTNGGDSLNGFTVSQILNAANQALAGLGLPSGYTFDNLNGLISNLNSAFVSGAASTWRMSHLSEAALAVQCAGQVPGPSVATVIAIDACSTVTVTSLPDVMTDYSCPSRYTIMRTWLAQDAAGNTNTYSYKIYVNDTTPPAITTPANRTVSLGQTWSFDQPTATDNCGPATIQVLSTVTNVVNPTTRKYTRTWQATDACGNASVGSQTITEDDSTPDLNVQFSAAGMTLTWPSPYVLQWSSTVTGPYTDVPGATSPYFYNTQTNPQKFFRLVAPPQIPVITSGPGSQIVGYGDSTTLSASVSGLAPLSYQWQVNGTNIPGATGGSLNFNPVQYNNAGIYTLVVNNGNGSVTSSPAILNVFPKLLSTVSGNGLTLAWTGPFILQSSTRPSGPYGDVPGATSPYTYNTKTNVQKYFRLRSQPFSLLGSNLPEGRFSVSGAGVPGCNFVIQASSNLVTWQNLQTNPSPCLFIDDYAWQSPRRFYRATLAP